MHRWMIGLGAAAVLSASWFAGCAAGNDATPASGEGGAGGGASGSAEGGAGSVGTGVGGAGGAASCAKFEAEAKQAPAAMLIVLDASASMTQNNKWGTAQLAVVSAIDENVFDSMSLGLVTFPASFVDPPQCLCDYACGGPGVCDIATCKQLLGGGVSCGVSALPQVPIAPAGTDKSNASMGVRHDIYQYLVGHSPLSNQDDGSPIYDALVAGYNALKAYPIDKRILVLVTDGGFSCTSVASPPRPGYSDGACPDWEYPDTVDALITSARTDAQKPINTFVVGVPGSDSHGEMQGSYATAPYSMRLALSTYAVSGSPDTVDPACDANATFSKNGADPAKPCHIDLSQGAFDASTLAGAISTIRGKALGCVYDLPDPPPGQTIDPNEVNVDVTLMGTTTTLKKRSDPADTCESDGCWDYDAQSKVELLGKACADVTAATDAKVEIRVGCQTIVK